jgi:quinol monooxygenase YgiN
MTNTVFKTNNEPMVQFLTEPFQIGQEISVTGKWVPKTPGGLFRKSRESKEMLKEWEDIHSSAKDYSGILSTEVNHAVGADAVLVHHVFKNPDTLVHYFETTANKHMQALMHVAKPEHHLFRGNEIPEKVCETVSAKVTQANFGEFLFGFVKDEYRAPDPKTAIQVTAKWTAKSKDHLQQLKHWWQMVGTDAHSLELGLLRFEVYQVRGEPAVIIHETFQDTAELQFHLAKGTANIYKKQIDLVADPECYFFRGPVSWTIRTYSKFLHLPATYSSLGSNYTQPSGSMSNGKIKIHQ